ncbi:hypothetical protein ABI59_08525 [Acidobacteria bacterium Mor1]|nr:hypothetical protein ABI59_08525 [Acidobacteria bacterium Mor1]
MSRRPARLFVLSTLLAGAAVFAEEPAPFSWPERAENLTSLPADLPAENLRAVMTGFTSALGVRCSHCHDGEEGAPLGAYDFVSDANPKKQTARVMLDMLGDINKKLRTIEPGGPARVNMWCHTCHRGHARPTTLAEELRDAYAAEGAGAGAVVARYRDLRATYHGRGTFDFGEHVLNQVGYQMLAEEKPVDAVQVFELNVEMYPQSANAHDSLGEGLAAAGNHAGAIEHYELSLQLDPGNDNAREMLKQLRSAAKSAAP